MNAENIRKRLKHLQETGWDAVVSRECHGADKNTRQSVEFFPGGGGRRLTAVSPSAQSATSTPYTAARELKRNGGGTRI